MTWWLSKSSTAKDKKSEDKFGESGEYPPHHENVVHAISGETSGYMCVLWFEGNPFWSFNSQFGDI